MSYEIATGQSRNLRDDPRNDKMERDCHSRNLRDRNDIEVVIARSVATKQSRNMRDCHPAVCGTFGGVARNDKKEGFFNGLYC